jgi:mannose-6-phosphate isomerase-like protein (cupin superfamily)
MINEAMGDWMQELDNEKVYDLDTFRRGRDGVNSAEVHSSPYTTVTMWTVLEGNTLPLRGDADAERILIVMAGMGKYTSAGVQNVVDEGMMVVMPPGITYDIRNVDISPLVVLVIEGQHGKKTKGIK